MLQSQKPKFAGLQAFFCRKSAEIRTFFGFLQNYAGFLQVFRDSSDDFLQKRAPFLQKIQKCT